MVTSNAQWKNAKIATRSNHFAPFLDCVLLRFHGVGKGKLWMGFTKRSSKAAMKRGLGKRRECWQGPVMLWLKGDRVENLQIGRQDKMESPTSRSPICATAPEELLENNLYILLWNESPTSIVSFPRTYSSPIMSWAAGPISHQRSTCKPPCMRLLLGASIACIHPEALKTCVHKNRFWATAICSQVEELQSYHLASAFLRICYKSEACMFTN